jgi:hypothetical protein
LTRIRASDPMMTRAAITMTQRIFLRLDMGREFEGES